MNKPYCALKKIILMWQKHVFPLLLITAASSFHALLSQKLLFLFGTYVRTVWSLIGSILTIQMTCFDFPYWKKKISVKKVRNISVFPRYPNYFHYLWLFPKFTVLTCLWKTVLIWNIAITDRDYHFILISSKILTPKLRHQGCINVDSMYITKKEPKSDNRLSKEQSFWP